MTVGLFPVAVRAQGAANKKPNILIIWGDDIGQFNLSAYNHGMMGYRTPNIDRIAKEGALFTDWYGQQSCTAGRAAFITGQSPIRTGLTKVGLPGAPEGMKTEDPTIADLLKALGYTTGQFGKNHLGDRNELLPTVHGFDEFLGNLYHLNAEEEPENVDYPKDPGSKRSSVRAVCSTALPLTRTTPPWTRDLAKSASRRSKTRARSRRSAWRRWTRKSPRARSTSWTRRTKDGKPFFVWWNSTRMHVFTHLKPASVGKTGLGIYADGMVEHDGDGG